MLERGHAKTRPLGKEKRVFAKETSEADLSRSFSLPDHVREHMTNMSPESKLIAAQSCPHGEERGPRKCALCRKAMPAGVRKADPKHTAAILRAIDPEPDQMMGFTSSLWAQVALPYRDPGDISMWVRRNNNVTLTMQPGIIKSRHNPIPRAGYPFGVIPRLLMVWLTTQALRTGERELLLEVTMNKFMEAIHLPPTGPNYRALGEQLARLAGCTMTVSTDHPTLDTVTNRKFTIANEWTLWWTPKDATIEGMLPNTVTLTEEFFYDIQHHALPVDMAHLAELRGQGGGGLPIDIYIWLSRYAFLAKRTGRPTWSQLANQFGSQYTRERDFKVKFRQALKKVVAVWPEFKVQEWEHGLMISPGKTPTRPRAIPR